MKFKSTHPEFLKFWNPIIDALKSLDGSGTRREVIDLAVAKMRIPEKELEEVYPKSGIPKIENQISWARAYLVMDGIIDSSQRGIWSLTEKGYEKKYTQDQIYERYKQLIKPNIEKALKAKSDLLISPDSTDSEDEKISIEDQHRAELLSILKTLEPFEFERVCQKLLREAGFEKVTVTKKTNDGGIDGEGILQINKLIGFKVKFQCKRYKDNNPVTSEMIQQFKGALDSSNVTKGIFITTSRFTPKAYQEAEKGKFEIQLINGLMLAELFESLELGLKKKTSYEIDQLFFEEYKKK